ncbi:MAG: hypothetical protein U9N45_07785, partial [Gemmatimonadota bacterium]|nr:hypothetical protein [Gemmatimonadota bacterium]
MEIWIIVLILVILLTAQLLYWIKSRGKVGNEKTAGFYFTPRGGLRAEVKANFRLAPRDPEVMAAVLYDLLSQRLSYQQMLAVCEFVASPEMTGRFIERLASRKDTSSLANQMAFLCN